MFGLIQFFKQWTISDETEEINQEKISATSFTVLIFFLCFWFIKRLFLFTCAGISFGAGTSNIQETNSSTRQWRFCRLTWVFKPVQTTVYRLFLRRKQRSFMNREVSWTEGLKHLDKRVCSDHVHRSTSCLLSLRFNICSVTPETFNEANINNRVSFKSRVRISWFSL